MTAEPAFWRSGPVNDGPSTAAKLALTEVIFTFKKWLYMEDPGVVLVVLASFAANRIASDPLWLMLVGASSGGKTETLNAISKLPDVYLAATMTEASLLSGTPKRERDGSAHGGLLRELGAFGVVVLKDFGSILSMDRNARASLMAALRELYDGSWTRYVGTDGGRTLQWEGKLGLIAGCTTAIDSHHAVMATLGERFLLFRLPLFDRRAFGGRALDNTGSEVAMRAELSAVVRRLFDSLVIPDTLPVLSAQDRDRLVSLASLISMARSAVERDGHTREIELVHDTEAPARLVQALRRLYAGLLIIGVEQPEAWRLVVKAGLDCMPKIRRTVFDLLAATKAPVTTPTIATATDYPTQTARRALEDLAAHKVTQRSKDGNSDLWQLSDEARSLLAEATVPEMWEDLTNPKTLVSNFSGTRPCVYCGLPVEGGDVHEDCEAEAAR
ncbi:MAG TPA: hypothetical protein VJB57_02990 [Dehalococcoidia bacterium]|nr:hypothetical protein [Dehalococcoidia bacterium]